MGKVSSETSKCGCLGGHKSGIGSPKTRERNETEALLSDTNNFIRGLHGQYLVSWGSHGPRDLPRIWGAEDYFWSQTPLKLTALKKGVKKRVENGVPKGP
jgi:hypothetical protein